MVIGKYGQMVLANMENNYPYRKKELEITGRLQIKLFEREQYLLNLKEKIEKEIKEEYKQPKTNEIYVVAKYQQMIEGLVEERLIKEILERI